MRWLTQPLRLRARAGEGGRERNKEGEEQREGSGAMCNKVLSSKRLHGKMFCLAHTLTYSAAIFSARIPSSLLSCVEMNSLVWLLTFARKLCSFSLHLLGDSTSHCTWRWKQKKRGGEESEEGEMVRERV